MKRFALVLAGLSSLGLLGTGVKSASASGVDLHVSVPIVTSGRVYTPGYYAPTYVAPPVYAPTYVPRTTYYYPPTTYYYPQPSYYYPAPVVAAPVYAPSYSSGFPWFGFTLDLFGGHSHGGYDHGHGGGGHGGHH